jgi:nitrous oxidase accessory protein NosD
MANLDAARGLQIAGPLLSCRMYKMSAAYAQALYIGDPMALDASGNAIIATAGTGNVI